MTFNWFHTNGCFLKRNQLSHRPPYQVDCDRLYLQEAHQPECQEWLPYRIFQGSFSQIFQSAAIRSLNKAWSGTLWLVIKRLTFYTKSGCPKVSKNKVRRLNVELRLRWLKPFLYEFSEIVVHNALAFGCHKITSSIIADKRRKIRNFALWF